ncbi:MAG: DUF4167 domain-containing protein [Bradyrhizobiaceae bacterium]|nr:MAG: DUF4167 domain-containing protein [Bradyrhizobiaceae bacterium]
MRNGQNNKRMRNNRSNNNNNHNNNRRGQNPMTRVFESNGPDIKIRGTASHVAEKYVQLARDARSSGDPVAAENYYQHAEHYFRLIAAAQEQLRQQQPQQQPRPDNNEMSDDMGDDADGYSNFGAEPGFAPQPVAQPQPQFVPREQPQPREAYRDNRPQPAIQNNGDTVGLPSFITGGAQPPVGGYESNGQGERYAHRRRRRPRPEGAPLPADNGTAQAADDFNPGND